ncbi:MAG: B12-binding domain-containing radical SAM protein [Chitinispirillaceae bacterium]|jgi:radical SAM superfamily enzyme YgiQ (UPF0313 family)|nr:B12-binding domain-containing radical SAM protein [Chitinispirillaceae bacterium]
MDIVLIHPNPGATGNNEATVEPPLGLASIAAVLEKDGFTVSIVDANLYALTEAETLDQIPPETKLVGISLNSFQYDSSRNLCTAIRKKLPACVIVLGGPVPTALDSAELLADFRCDGLVRGEGEYSLLHIARNIRERRPFNDGKPSGLASMTNGSLAVSAVERILDLDALPFPAYHLLPHFSRYKTRARKKPVAAIITSRGCAFNCSFCSKDIFQRKVTYHSAEYIIGLVGFLVREYGIRQIDILDDNFAMNRKRFNDILDMLIEKKFGLAINLQSGIRAEYVDDTVLAKMKLAGVFKISFGIESADEKVLRLNCKELNLSHIRETVFKCKQADFLTYGFFIIGLPGETDEGFAKTIRFAQDLNLDIANFCMAIPFANTELYKDVRAHGRVLIDTSKHMSTGFYAGQAFYEYGDNTAEILQKRYALAYRTFYSLTRRVKILLSVRSLSELAWVIESGFSIFINILRSKSENRREVV